MSLSLLLLLLACGVESSVAPPEPVQVAAPEPTAAPEPPPVDAQMRNHWLTATAARDRVVHGDLAGARVIARGLADRAAPEGFDAEMQAHYEQMTGAAATLAAASSVEDAGLAVGQLGLTCANCHAFSGGGPKTVALPKPPPELADPTHDMAVHQWGLDWLWYGLVANDSEAWTRGAKGLEEAPFSGRKDLPHSHVGLEAMEHLVHLLPGVTETGSREERAQRLGEIVAVCALCHGEVQAAGIKTPIPTEKE